MPRISLPLALVARRIGIEHKRGLYPVDKESKANYDSFAHLCRSLFVQDSDLMSMLTVYCDDSGTDTNSRIAVVAGYIGEVGEWEKFDITWRQILGDFAVTQVHRTDLENFRGEFSRDQGWCEERRVRFLKKLHAIINLYTLVPIGSLVIKQDFEEIIPESLKRKYGGHYGWCVQECVVAATCWHEDTQQFRNSIDWVFEAGTKGYGQVSQMFNELYHDPEKRRKFHIGSWSFARKDMVPLQAADILAYELFKQGENRIVEKGENYPIRKSAISLLQDQGVEYVRYWDKSRLKEWLNKANEGPS